jgi:hypothetical protein
MAGNVGPSEIRMETCSEILKGYLDDYGPVKDNGVWRTRYSNELYTLYDKLNTVRMIKMGRLLWLGHLFRMQELDPCRKLTFLKQGAPDA